MDEPEVVRDDEGTRFMRDVELLRAGKPLSEMTEAPYSRADLEMADLLTRARFVPSAEFRSKLQNKLHSQPDIKGRDSMSMFASSLFRQMLKGAVAVGVTAALVMATVLVVSPEARAQAQGLVARFVEVDSPWAPLTGVSGSDSEESNTVELVDGQTGEHSSFEATRSEAPAPDSAESPAASRQEGLPAPSDLPLDLPADLPADLPKLTLPGDAASRLEGPSMISFEEAQAGTSFTIKMPASLPGGYSFQGVFKPPSPPNLGDSLPDDALPREGSVPSLPSPVTLVFENAAGEKLMLTEVSLTVSGAGEVSLPAGRGSVQEVSVNGQSGQYVEGAWSRQGWDSGAAIHQLHWQGADGVTYTLVSHTLGLDEMLATAQSVP